MFFIKQLLSFCKLYSFYEELPEEFLGETGVDSYQYQNIFDFPQYQRRKERVREGSSRKDFSAMKLMHFCDLKIQQRFRLQEEKKATKAKNHLIF